MKALSFFLPLAIALGLLSGCKASPQSNYDAVTLVEVSGTVTLDDKPLPNAIVKFEGENGQRSMGKTDEAGNYTLDFDSEKKGTTPGEKIVRISTAASLGEGGEEEAPPGEEGGEGESEIPKKTELVPEKYNTKSQEKVTVEAPGPQTINFDLKSK
jgi:hypothetical protein